MNIMKIRVVAAQLGVFLTMSGLAATVNAVPLVWNTGFWGDTWQSLPTSGTDSDGDGVVDSKDFYPADPGEWGNADGDGLGDIGDLDDDNDGVFDHPDPDDDNDGLSDLAENDYGSNPLLPDTDEDGINDGDEVDVGRNPVVHEGAIMLLINSE